VEPTVLRIIGKNFRPEKDEEMNIWWSTHHVPLILTGQAVAGKDTRGSEKISPIPNTW